jgi:NTE family protein
MTDHTQPIDLVLEGGGVKGVGLVGALAVLHERGFRPERVAGTSAGAIAAALVAAGYEHGELYEILKELDFERFMDKGPEDRVPLIGRPLSVLTQQGVYEGDEFLTWIEGKLADRGITTFGDLIYDDAPDPKRRHRLQVIASDITARNLLILPRDAAKFGVKPDDLPVAHAIRMSMGIPIFFEPWRWRPIALEDRADQAADDRYAEPVDHLIVDGGVLSNFPVWLFDCPPDQRRFHTFGLLLVEDDPKLSVDKRLDREPPKRRSGPAIIELAKGLMQTMLEAHDRMYVENDTYLRTIMVSTCGVKTTEFNLSLERRHELYESGRRAAEHFLDDRWNPDEYAAVVDAERTPSRAEVLGAAIPEIAGD